MTRRSLLTLGLALAGAGGLAACGFKLRGTQTFAFDSVAVAAPQNGPVAAELRQALGGKLFAPAPGPTPGLPQVTVDILSEQREKSVVGISAAGQVREFQLRLRVKFRLRNPQGKELIPDTEISQQRSISYNESAALAKEVEENTLYRDMQTDIVGQLARQLAAVKSIQ